MLETPIFCAAGWFGSPCTHAKARLSGETVSNVAGGGPIVPLYVRVAVDGLGVELSIAVAVNWNDPVALAGGVPLNTPPVLKFSPAGNPVALQLYGPVPP